MKWGKMLFATALTLAFLFSFVSLPIASAALDDSNREMTGIFTSARLPSLYEAYQDYFMIGTIFNDLIQLDPVFTMTKRHFNVLTSEWQMKSGELAHVPGVFGFDHVDSMLAMIKDAGIAVHGHALLWHNQHADWLTNDSDGEPLTRAEAIRNMTNYVDTVAGHFAGRLISWDVVNEAVAWKGEPPSGSYYAIDDSLPWYRAFANGADESAGESGADYVEMAFRLARRADPGATLYYNDYGMDNPEKAAVIVEMVRGINEKWLAEGNDRLLIEGVGMQGHYGDYIDVANVERTIRSLIDLGVEISISELDVSIRLPESEMDNAQLFFEQQLKLQADMFAKLFQIFKRYSPNIARVSFWGIDDATSWITDNYPLLFDENYNPKLAYFAVADPEGYLSGKFDTQQQRDAWIEANGLAR